MYFLGRLIGVDDYTYGTHVVPLDTIAQACALCFTPIFFNRQRRVPDELCMGCYNTWKDQRFEPWLVFLCRREMVRRNKIQRMKKRGLEYIPTAFDDESDHDEDGDDDGNPYYDPSDDPETNDED